MNNSKNNTGRRRELLKGKKPRQSASTKLVLEWIISPNDAHLAARAVESGAGLRVELPVILF